MDCILNDLIAPLAALNTVEALFANDNSMWGLLNGPDILKSSANWTALTTLSLQEMPDLQGPFPADCAPPYQRLRHALFTGTQIWGPVPPCLLQTVQTLEVARTPLNGTFPSLKGSPVRYA
jgi:hypothetical protein